ncbi:MAG: hypothetical protein JNJ78_23745, partial [Anaerolineae bacterium]|nr:hypothetical protein [Anaerolineae bacterium]
MYAEVAIHATVYQTYDYQVPPELIRRIRIGQLVHVPFGTALQHGIIL